MKTSMFVATVATLFALVAAGPDKCPTPPTVDTISVPKYMGVWYEISANKGFKDILERGLECTTANYTLDASSGMVHVDNSGIKDSPTGTRTHAIGKAKQVSGGKLEVAFFADFYGPYWVIDLIGDAPYQVSMVYSCVSGLLGVEDLWILSRTPQLPSGVTLDSLFAKAQTYGINTTALQMIPTAQPSNCVYGN